MSSFDTFNKMNLLLLHPSDFISSSTVRIADRRALHLLKVLEVNPGDTIRAGTLNGLIGQATIISITQEAEIQLSLALPFKDEPPAPLPCRLIMALPRPKMLHRILQSCASMGIKEIHLINSWKVEKSYWQSPKLDESSLQESLLLGLEQAIDTKMPTIKAHRLFKPFVEDQLPSIIGESSCLIAHPYTSNKCPISIEEHCSLIIGPEGGFTDYELEKMITAGAKAVTVGARILRVETAIPAILGRLYSS